MLATNYATSTRWPKTVAVLALIGPVAVRVVARQCPNPCHRRDPRLLAWRLDHWATGPYRGCSCTRCFHHPRRRVPASEVVHDRVATRRELERLATQIERLRPELWRGVHRYFDASISHLPPDELGRLTEAAALFDAEAQQLLSAQPRRSGTQQLREDFRERHGVPVVVDHRYGFWINVPANDDPELERRRATAMPNLHGLLALARAHDCLWVNLDVDADVSSLLPTYGLAPTEVAH